MSDEQLVRVCVALAKLAEAIVACHVNDRSRELALSVGAIIDEIAASIPAEVPPLEAKPLNIVGRSFVAETVAAALIANAGRAQADDPARLARQIVVAFQLVDEALTAAERLSSEDTPRSEP